MLKGRATPMGKMTNAYKILTRNSEVKGLLQLSRLRQEDNIKLDLKGTGCEKVGWIHLVQDRISWLALTKAVLNVDSYKLQ
jgi:hypothetical protein